jgi:acyl-coenzyme A synthetase/AMP-(fatty) acid ligase
MASEGRPRHHLHADDPEAAYAMLACTRIGAVHSIVFGGFSPDSARRPHRRLRIELVITADEGLRGGKKIPLKANVDAALEAARRMSRWKNVSSCAAPAATAMQAPGRDVWYHGEVATVKAALRAGKDERRGSAVHPLHLRLDRQAEGRAAHHRRLPRLCLDDP